MPEISLQRANSRLAIVDDQAVIDAEGLYYRELNELLREALTVGATHLAVRNVRGQRYIGTNLQRPVRIDIEGVPGNDLGAFMDGPDIWCSGNAQDGCGNTMNSGRLVINGSAGDILGHSMRGGAIYVRWNVGYRVGIHMKEYGEAMPVIVIGGTAQHFLGEYMAGGVLIVLGRQFGPEETHPARYIGAGMHGGVMYVRGRVDERFIGKEVGIAALGSEDAMIVSRYVQEYGRLFGVDVSDLLADPFVKLYPKTKRPYGRLYAY
ncbi:MAG: hypothetical protein ABFD20_00055 [Anaerolineales bacterium]